MNSKRRFVIPSILALTMIPVIVLGVFPPFPDPAVGPFPDGTEFMRFRGQLVPAQINAITPRAGVLLNDIGGWVSPAGEAYALVGTSDGLSIVRVTDPDNPEFIGQVRTTDMDAFNNLWGDPAVFNKDDGKGSFTGYAYFTTEADGVGIHILELNQLDAMGPAPNPMVQIPATAVFDAGGYDSAHNIFTNQETGFAYVAGVNLVGSPTACDSDPNHPSRFNTLILDLTPDPLNPSIAACLADRGEHDFYVVNYNGPDDDYQDKEIAFVFDGRDKDAAGRNGARTDGTPGVPVGGETEIWDVTDKNNIQFISTIVPEGLCFSNQGWTSSDRHEFLLINDEVDEPRDAEPNDGTGFFRTNFCQSDDPQNPAPNPSVYVVNIQDLDVPVFQERFFIDAPGENDHNFVRKGNKLFWAVYNAGTRVLKMEKKAGILELEEVARLDSEPRPIVPPFFNGQWGVFPFPDRNTIVASDIVNGLVVMSICVCDLAARAKSGKVQLTWTHTGADSYNVYRSTTAGGPYVQIANTTSTFSTYLDAGLVNGTTYYYVVSEVVGGEEVCESAEASATPQGRRRR